MNVILVGPPEWQKALIPKLVTGFQLSKHPVCASVASKSWLVGLRQAVVVFPSHQAMEEVKADVTKGYKLCRPDVIALVIGL